MKLIRAIVRSEMVTEITAAFDAARVDGVTILGAAGSGAIRKKGAYRGRLYVVLEPIHVVEVMAADEVADEIVKILLCHAHTGRPGDGHVMVMPIDARYSIRTRWLSVA